MTSTTPACILETIRTMRATHEAALAVCPHWDDAQRAYLEAMINQSYDDEARHA